MTKVHCQPPPPTQKQTVLDSLGPCPWRRRHQPSLPHSGINPTPVQGDSCDLLQRALQRVVRESLHLVLCKLRSSARCCQASSPATPENCRGYVWAPHTNLTFSRQNTVCPISPWLPGRQHCCTWTFRQAGQQYSLVMRVSPSFTTCTHRQNSPLLLVGPATFAYGELSPAQSPLLSWIPAAALGIVLGTFTGLAAPFFVFIFMPHSFMIQCSHPSSWPQPLQLLQRGSEWSPVSQRLPEGL